MKKLKENLFVKFLKENFNAIKVSVLNGEFKEDENIEDKDLNKTLQDVEKMEVKFEKNTKLTKSKSTKNSGTSRKPVTQKVKVKDVPASSKTTKKKIEKDDFER